MTNVLALKMKKILIILSIIALNGGPSIYASTYQGVLKEANNLGSSGKILAEIDFLLKMRNLNTMTLDQYALFFNYLAFFSIRAIDNYNNKQFYH